VEEFRGYEASKKMLLSFVRRTQADMIDITHFCCHRGKGVAIRDYGIYKPKRIPHEEATEILDEENEFHELLEEDMKLWMNQCSKVLRSQWMILLKKTHDNTAKATNKDRGRGQANFVSDTEVDDKLELHANETAEPESRLQERPLYNQCYRRELW
jgi:hypothetical protein